jgi:hypothetical protein
LYEQFPKNQDVVAVKSSELQPSRQDQTFSARTKRDALDALGYVVAKQKTKLESHSHVRLRTARHPFHHRPAHDFTAPVQTVGERDPTTSKKLSMFRAAFRISASAGPPTSSR